MSRQSTYSDTQDKTHTADKWISPDDTSDVINQPSTFTLHPSFVSSVIHTILIRFIILLFFNKNINRTKNDMLSQLTPSSAEKQHMYVKVRLTWANAALTLI